MTWLPFQKVGGDETNHYHTGNLSKGLGKEPKLCVVIMLGMAKFQRDIWLFFGNL